MIVRKRCVYFVSYEKWKILLRIWLDFTVCLPLKYSFYVVVRVRIYKRDDVFDKKHNNIQFYRNIYNYIFYRPTNMNVREFFLLHFFGILFVWREKHVFSSFFSSDSARIYTSDLNSYIYIIYMLYIVLVLRIFYTIIIWLLFYVYWINMEIIDGVRIAYP